MASNSKKQPRGRKRKGHVEILRPTKRPFAGRPAHVPNEISIGQVTIAARYGVPETEIAEFIGVAPKTLRKHYRRILDKSRFEFKNHIKAKLATLALGAPATYDGAGRMLTPAVAPDRVLLMFLAKTQCGMKEETPVRIGMQPSQDGSGKQEFVIYQDRYEREF